MNSIIEAQAEYFANDEVSDIFFSPSYEKHIHYNILCERSLWDDKMKFEQRFIDFESSLIKMRAAGIHVTVIRFPQYTRKQKEKIYA
jgi:hypothetical protein